MEGEIKESVNVPSEVESVLDRIDPPATSKEAVKVRKSSSRREGKKTPKIRYKSVWGYCFCYSLFVGIVHVVVVIIGLALRYLICLCRQDYDFGACWKQLQF